MAGERKSDVKPENGYHSLQVGERVIEIPGLRINDDISETLRRKEVKGVVSKLHFMEKDVVAKITPGKLVLYVGAVGVLGSAVAGAVFLRKRKHKS